MVAPGTFLDQLLGRRDRKPGHRLGRRACRRSRGEPEAVAVLTAHLIEWLFTTRHKLLVLIYGAQTGHNAGPAGKVDDSSTLNP